MQLIFAINMNIYKNAYKYIYIYLQKCLCKKIKKETTNRKNKFKKMQNNTNNYYKV